MDFIKHFVVLYEHFSCCINFCKIGVEDLVCNMGLVSLLGHWEDHAPNLNS